MTTTEQLERLHNRATAYEVEAFMPANPLRRVLIGYTQRHTRTGLLAACRRNGQMVIDALGLSDTDLLVAGTKASDGFGLGAWQVRFSGRTQRDAICNGELTWIGDLAKRVA